MRNYGHFITYCIEQLLDTYPVLNGFVVMLINEIFLAGITLSTSFYGMLPVRYKSLRGSAF